MGTSAKSRRPGGLADTTEAEYSTVREEDGRADQDRDPNQAGRSTADHRQRKAVLQAVRYDLFAVINLIEFGNENFLSNFSRHFVPRFPL